MCDKMINEEVIQTLKSCPIEDIVNFYAPLVRTRLIGLQLGYENMSLTGLQSYLNSQINALNQSWNDSNTMNSLYHNKPTSVCSPPICSQSFDFPEIL